MQVVVELDQEPVGQDQLVQVEQEVVLGQGIQDVPQECSLEKLVPSWARRARRPGSAVVLGPAVAVSDPWLPQRKVHPAGSCRRWFAVVVKEVVDHLHHPHHHLARNQKPSHPR